MTALSAAPARAQNGGGYNDVTFWDDSDGGPLGDDADVVTPATAAADGFVYLNPDGGRTSDDGLLVIVGPGHYQVIRDRDWQIYSSGWDEGEMEWIVFADGACFTWYYCDAGSGPAPYDVYENVYWESSVTLTQDGPTTWAARLVNTAEYNGRTYTLTIDSTYTPPGNYVRHTATLDITPDDPEGEIHLYLGSDMYLDGSDDGPGYVGGFMGDALTAQINATAALGITADGGGYTSLFEGYYKCSFSYEPSSCGIYTSADPATYPDVDDDPNAWFGPSLGRPYPMDPPIVNGGSVGDDPEVDIDAGIAMHWNITGARTVKAAFWAGTRAEFDAALKSALPEPQLTTAGFLVEEEEVVTPPAECQLDPDMAITPEAISLAAGGRTTVTVTLRNLCSDAPLTNNDLLLSLSDGLRIVGGSNGLVNLGQRGAFQRFMLSAGETRSFIFEVEAASALTVAPLHVAELYRGGRVVKRIDGVFVGATVAAPAPAVVAPAPAPVQPAAPAPLPTALPNTAGEGPVLLLVALLGLGLIGFGVRSLKRR